MLKTGDVAVLNATISASNGLHGEQHNSKNSTVKMAVSGL
jgi:hypothetical protein